MMSRAAESYRRKYREAEALGATKQRVVMAHGVFDVLHPGHIEHLRQAKELGERLVVAVLSDSAVRKGPGYPVFNQIQRAEAVRALRFVDEAYIVSESEAMPILQAMKPDVFCKGPDYADPSNTYAKEFAAEKAFVESYGGKVILTTGEKYSSTELSKTLPKQYRDAANVRYWLDKAKSVNAMVIGEEITDEYVYVSPLFKSAKENIVTQKEVGREVWAGGAQIVRQDLVEFAGSASMLLDGPPVLKTRYVDAAFKQKLFAITTQPDIKPLRNDWTPNELTVVADYGHGLIGPEEAKQIAAKKTFLAITVQSNSSNWGFNLLTKWPRADYVVIDQNELRLACADQHGDILRMAWEQATRLGTRFFVVTLGHEGCLVVSIHGGHSAEVNMPALADKVVDRMGAGDAFLAATAPLAQVGAPAEVIALVGNVAAAIKVSKVGNAGVTRKEVDAWLTTHASS